MTMAQKVELLRTDQKIDQVMGLVLRTGVILAAVIVPFVIITVRRALRGDFVRHRAIARWTLPLWFYVSVTGVIVYLMLYQM